VECPAGVELAIISKAGRTEEILIAAFGSGPVERRYMMGKPVCVFTGRTSFRVVHAEFVVLGVRPCALGYNIYRLRNLLLGQVNLPIIFSYLGRPS
jgi:hypothetical protein